MGLISRFKGVMKGIAASPVIGSPGSGGWSRIFESYAGAWQQNVVKNQTAPDSYYAVFSCVTQIASDISKLAVRSEKYGAGGVWKPLDGKDQPVTFTTPNRYQTWQQYIEHWLCSKLLHGNAYTLIVRNENYDILEFRILNPNLVLPLITADGEVFYQLSADNVNALKQSVVVPAREIIHDRFNTLHHPLIGLSPLYACGAAATHGTNIQTDNSNFFANGGRPGGVITVPGNVPDSKINAIKETWEAGYSGNNAGRTAVLADGMVYKQFEAYKASDNQVVEQLNMTAVQVAACYHVPGYKIGLQGVSMPANTEAYEQTYYSQCLQPLMEAIETMLARAFSYDLYKQRVQFTLDALLRMDTAARYTTYAQGVGAAILTPNEARRKENLAPVIGGDSAYLQQQNYSLEALYKRDQQEDPFATGGSTAPAVIEENPQPADDDTPTDSDKAMSPADLEVARLILKGVLAQ